MKAGIAFGPPEREVVEPNDGRVRGRPLTEVDPPVEDDRPVRVVVAEAREPVDEHCRGAVRRDAEERAALEVAAGDEERPVRVVDAGPRRVVAARDLGGRPARPDAEEPGRPSVVAVGVAGLGHVDVAGLVERDARREREALGDRLDLVAREEGDVGRVHGARRVELGEPAALRGEQAEAAGQDSRQRDERDGPPRPPEWRGGVASETGAGRGHRRVRPRAPRRRRRRAHVGYGAPARPHPRPQWPPRPSPSTGGVTRGGPSPVRWPTPPPVAPVRSIFQITPVWGSAVMPWGLNRISPKSTT